MNSSAPSAAVDGAVGELAGQAQLAHRALARDLLFLAAADALVGALDHEVEQLVGLRRIAGEPVVERVLDRAARRCACASAVARRSLVWPWNSGSRMNTESMQAAPAITSSLVTVAARLPWLVRSAWSLMPRGERAAQARTRGCRRRASGWCCSRTTGSRRRRRQSRPPIRPCRGRRSSPTLPAKMSGCTSVAPLMVAVR